MPLYVRKSHYRYGDPILAIVQSGWEDKHAYIKLVIGHYEPLRLVISGIMLPAIQPYWQLEYQYPNRTLKLRETFGSEKITISDAEGDATHIEGVVFGRLDMGDWYAVRSYLKRCLYHARKKYENEICLNLLRNR